MTWNGPEELKSLLVPTEGLREHPKNPRVGNVKRIMHSVRVFGQTKPIVVRDGVIIAGNHTFKALRELGWDHIAAVEFTGSEEEALAYLIADNRTTDDSAYENQVLADILTDLQSVGMLDGVGWSESEIDDLWLSLEETAPELPDENPPDPEPKEDIGTSLRPIALTFEQEDFDMFHKYVGFLEDKMNTRGMVSTVFETVKIAATEAGFEDK